MLLLTDETTDYSPFAADEVIYAKPGNNLASNPLHIDIARDAEIITAYTSGSTGVPKAYSKTWAALLDEAHRIDSALNISQSATHVGSPEIRRIKCC